MPENTQAQGSELTGGLGVAKTLRFVRVPLGKVGLAESAFCFVTYAERWALKLEVLESGEWKGVPFVDA